MILLTLIYTDFVDVEIKKVLLTLKVTVFFLKNVTGKIRGSVINIILIQF